MCPNGLDYSYNFIKKQAIDGTEVSFALENDKVKISANGRAIAPSNINSAANATFNAIKTQEQLEKYLENSSIKVKATDGNLSLSMHQKALGGMHQEET